MQTWEAQPTSVIPTAIPIPASDSFQIELLKHGYKLGFSTSTVGPGEYTYSANIFSNHGDNTSPEMPKDSRIAFYRFDGKTNLLLRTFSAPEYLGGSIYSGYPPVWISPNYMPFWYEVNGWPDSGNGSLRHLFGEWTDINNNGLPELVLSYEYCPNACVDDNGEATHFYEIQTTSKIVDITADLPGVIASTLYFHSRNPVEIFVYDPTLWYCYKWCIIDTWWIYAWDGQKFVDVSPKYANEYLAKGAKLIREIQQLSKEGFPEWRLLSILFLYEKAGLRKQAFELFMDISAPSRWPDVSTEELCWLQFARATVSEDYRLGKPFHFPAFNMASEFISPSNAIQRNIQLLDELKSTYEMSACVKLLSTRIP